MSDEILSASNKLIANWAQEIIKRYKLSKGSSTTDLTDCIIKFFKEKLPGYEIGVYDITKPTIKFDIRKIKPLKETKKKSKDELMDDLFDDIFTPATEEEKNLASKLLVVFNDMMKKLDFIHPIHYPEIIKKIGLQTFEEPPNYSDDNFILWGTKCVEYFNFTKSTPILDLIKNSITFFDMLFTTYSIRYSKYKQHEKFPVYVEKLADRPLMWATETDKVRKSYLATYIHILEILKRRKDYPKDSEFFYSLVQVYEILGIKPRAKYFGKIALSLNHHDTFELSQLVMYYAEQKRFQDGTIYMKKLGAIYQQKGQKKLALQMWQGASRFDQGPDVAAALITLYNDLGMKNELNQIISYVKMNISKYKEIKDLIEKF